MYDFASVRGSTDRFWQSIRTGLGQGPDELCRDLDVWDAWARPDLLLSQTCGLPYRSRLHGKVVIVGTPDYGLPGCGPGEYNSVFLARECDPRETLPDFDGARIAVNSQSSQSGWAGPIMHARAKGVGFAEAIKSGAHVKSADAVINGTADIAAIDALSWRFIHAEEAFAAELKVIDATPPTPGLPYITALDRDTGAIFDAIEQAIATLSDHDRAALCLNGLVRIEPEAYLAVPTPPPPRFN
ncbi:MAG: PhnD/SsuA/transferrin family substrate-binding protein [Pseudomonadota bacterium]